MKLTQRLKVMLRALLVKAGELHAEKNGEAVTLIFDGETAEVGVEVFVEQQNGDEVEVNPAPDGEYNVDDKVYVVRDGKIAEIKDKEQPEEPKEEETPETPADPDPDPTPDPDQPVDGAEEPEAEPADNQDEPEPEAEEDRLARMEARLGEITEAIETILNAFGALESRVAEMEAKVAKLDGEPAGDPVDDREDMSETPKSRLDILRQMKQK